MQYNAGETDEILNIFKAESEEIIQKLNDRFMELEKNPADKTPIKELFQLAHSLKGAARMIGFNGIQNIAHKLEDILSYWKNDNIEINTHFFSVIYKVCDFLSELIIKSVSLKEDCKDENVNIFIEQLNNFISDNTSTKNDKEQKSLDYIINKEMDINAILLELIFVLEKENIETDFDESVQVLKENFEQLYEIFVQTEYTEIKEQIEFLMTFTANAINQKSDIEFLKQRISELRSIIYNLYKDFDIVSVKKNNVPAEEHKLQTVELSYEDKIISENFDFILSNLQKIKTDKNFIQDILNHLNNIIKFNNDKKISLILDKVVSILNKISAQNKKFTNDCYMVILQSIFMAKRISVKDGNNYESSYHSLMQRLTVVEDMFNLVQIPSAGEKSSVSDLKHIDFNQKFQSIDFKEIRTLRVDTTKLDNLISQTGELLINGIKTREHIVELSKINNKLIKWNGVSKKILNYIKYLEKKGFFSSETDDNAGGFYKRTQHFFLDNAEIINEINKDFSDLYNIIAEDDNKLHQTAIEIEAIAKGIRVLPLAALFHSFPRMIRDIAKENNKKIDFIISGSDTAVDKKIIEEIKMPLIHILRNSIAHGIELPEERIKQGKNEVGTVRLITKQEENNVIITIEDDGYGVNIEKIKEKALQKGLLTEEEVSNASSKQLMKLIFFPGFSTEESVTEISGRGIGLDVVKTKIANLNGEIFVDSVLNQGCRVTIRLPLSMSTIKTFILRVNNQKYAIPVNAVKFVTQISKDKIFEKNGIKSIIYEKHSIPINSLSKLFGGTEKICEENNFLTILILENHEKQCAYILDELIGDQEVFQKKLMAPIIKIKNISGFTILPTGEICLIINPYELLRNTNG